MRKITLIPPPELVQYVGGHFEEVGKEFMQYFIEIGNLKSNETVLDVGCGIGRMAVPLMNYFSDDGNYYGFDLFNKGITWCKNNISTRRNNFHFEHVDIYNQFYNPDGKKMLPNTSFHMKMNHSILFFNVCIYPSSSERIRTLRTRDCTSSEKRWEMFYYFLFN